MKFRERYPWWLIRLMIRNEFVGLFSRVYWRVKGMRWWPYRFLSWLWMLGGWALVAALVVRADAVDVGLAAFGRLCYLCALDPVDAEYHLARTEVTRRYMRRLAEIDIDLGKARARCARW